MIPFTEEVLFEFFLGENGWSVNHINTFVKILVWKHEFWCKRNKFWTQWNVSSSSLFLFPVDLIDSGVKTKSPIDSWNTIFVNMLHQFLFGLTFKLNNNNGYFFLCCFVLLWQRFYWSNGCNHSFPLLLVNAWRASVLIRFLVHCKAFSEYNVLILSEKVVEEQQQKKTIFRCMLTVCINTARKPFYPFEIF